MYDLCRKIWEEEGWKQSVIVPVFKKKDRLCCDNYRGISLLPHCEKLLATIILERIKRKNDEALSEAQAGSRCGRSMIDQLFTLRRMSELYTEFGKHLFVCYVDFRKVFDSVWRTGLWHVVRHLHFDEKIVRILEALYKDTVSAVRVDGELSGWFSTTIGVLQGCVLSPLLFNILLEVVMLLALFHSNLDVSISGCHL